MSAEKPVKSSIFVCANCKTEKVAVKTTRQRKDLNVISEILLKPSKQSDKKYSVKINGNKTINFGARGMSDFTIHKDVERQSRYITRKHKREGMYWDPAIVANLYTGSFWARFLLWQHKDIFEAISELETVLKVPIKFTKATIERHQRKLAKTAKKMDDEDE